MCHFFANYCLILTNGGQPLIAISASGITVIFGGFCGSGAFRSYRGYYFFNGDLERQSAYRGFLKLRVMNIRSYHHLLISFLYLLGTLTGFIGISGMTCSIAWRWASRFSGSVWRSWIGIVGEWTLLNCEWIENIAFISQMFDVGESDCGESNEDYLTHPGDDRLEFALDGHLWVCRSTLSGDTLQQIGTCFMWLLTVPI